MANQYQRAQSAVLTDAQGRPIDRASYHEGLRKFMLRVYNYMILALLIAGGTAFAISSVAPLQELFFNVQVQGGQAYITGYSAVGWVAVLGTLGLLLFSGTIMQGRSVAAAQAVFWLLAAGIGVSVAATLIMYTGHSVARVFLITAATFAAVSLYGYTTKRNLEGIGRFAFIGAIVLLAVSMVNIFLGSSMLVLAISGFGVVIAVAMIAANTQMLKELYAEEVSTEQNEKMAILGALGLFVWFVNLFQFLMIFLGQRE